MKFFKKLNNFNKISCWIASAFILILSLFPLIKLFSPKFRSINEAHYIALIIGGCIGLLFLYLNIDKLRKEYKENKPYFNRYILIPIILFVTYMIWTLLSTLLAKDRDLAFHGTTTRKDGYNSYILYAGCFGLAFSIFSEKFKKALICIFPIITVILLSLFDIHSIGLLNNIVFINNFERGPFWNSNHYGYYLLIATSISCFLFIAEDQKYFKLIWLIIYSFILYHLILNNTFGCYLALMLTLIFSLLLACIKKYKKLYIILAIIIFIFTSFGTTAKARKIVNRNLSVFFKDVYASIVKIESHSSPSETEEDEKWLKTGSGRMVLWVTGIKSFIKNPIIGYGPENLVYKFIEAGIYESYTAHNFIIQLLAISGFPGFILYMSALRYYFNKYIIKYE